MSAVGELRCMSLQHALAVGRAWLEAGGNPELDIAALEPLLWRDGTYRIGDLVWAMTDAGFSVAMTTNGQLLAQHAKTLAAAKLTKLRISWHSTVPQTFRQISATGNYDAFLKGVNTAIEVGIPTTFNRLLLRGHTGDLVEHVAAIDSLRSKMKLYDLLWTPNMAGMYEQYYVNAIETANELLASLPKRALERSGKMGRRRVQFQLENGGLIEVKESENISRESEPCSACVVKDNCLEAFGDYVRVEPDLRLYFCYLRRDFGIDLATLLDRDSRSTLLEEIDLLTRGRAMQLVRHSSLRYIAVPMCNFNCGFPGSATSWCHKATGNFRFPPRIKDRMEAAA